MKGNKNEKKLFEVFAFIQLLGFNIYADDLTINRVGWWKFNDTTNIVQPVSGYGLPLELVGTHQVIGGPTAGDFAAKIGVGSHYKMKHQISPNGGGTKVNEFTLQIDFKVEALGVWHTFFETTPANNNDADCAINPNGFIGLQATTYSTRAIAANEWYRLVVSVKNGVQYKYYLDGGLLNNGTIQSVDGRFSLDTLLLMFADDDGDDGPIIVSEIGIWDRALTAQEVKTLGGFGHQDRVGWWKFNDTTNIVQPVSGYGLPLELVGTHQVIGGPTTGDFAAKIGVGSHYKMKHQISPNGGGTKVNEFTLQIDFKVEALGVWHTFFETTPANNNDADCAINPNGFIGLQATTYSTYAIAANEWYRLVVSVKNGVQYKYYLDGDLLNNGTIQSVDGRFSLDTLLLMFADDDGDDGPIIVSEIGIWDKALTAQEVKNLGGFGHRISSGQLVLVPYLQTPTTNSMHVCWHDTITTPTSVEYGTTSSLGQTISGTSEVVAGSYIWHSVKLTGLRPNTEYYYKAISGSGSSKIYNFKTLPDSTYKGKIRFLLLSDTHNGDTSWAVKVNKQARKKIEQLYGTDIHNHLTAVLHSGDLVIDGDKIIQWTDQYFAPMSSISPNVPFMTVAGNHEYEHSNYYKYMKYDDVQPFASASEKFWSFRVANTIIIGLNSNATGFFTLQKIWLDQVLAQAEADSTIDFIYVMSHHFAVSELWGEGITNDPPITKFITNDVYATLQKYSKVVQHSYGHTHGYERGTWESAAVNPRGDFRIVCGGGGGGFLDRWGLFKNNDFSNVHVSIDNYFYQIIEIDPANKTYESRMYSLGNTSKARDNEVMDTWYKKVNQSAPKAPTTNVPKIDSTKITFNTSSISGDSLMTVRIQVSQNGDFSTTVIDTMIHWKNIYLADANYNPINRNAGIDLTKLSFPSSRFNNGALYYYRVRYRDHNVSWSGWSNVTAFKFVVTGVKENVIPKIYSLEQNYPNPFNPTTTIKYGLPVDANVKIEIFNMLGQKVAELVNEVQTAHYYEINWDARNISSGMYIYKLEATEVNNSANKFTSIKKMILMK